MRSDLQNLEIEYEKSSLFSCVDNLAQDVEEMYIDPEDVIERGPNYFRANTWKGDHTEEYSSKELGGAFTALTKMEATSLEMEVTKRSNRYNATNIEGEKLYGVLECVSAVAEERM